jgi:hypothetical protein
MARGEFPGTTTASIPPRSCRSVAPRRLGGPRGEHHASGARGPGAGSGANLLGWRPRGRAVCHRRARNPAHLMGSLSLSAHPRVLALTPMTNDVPGRASPRATRRHGRRSLPSCRRRGPRCSAPDSAAAVGIMERRVRKLSQPHRSCRFAGRSSVRTDARSRERGGRNPPPAARSKQRRCAGKRRWSATVRQTVQARVRQLP